MTRACIALATLIDYWSDDLGADEEAIELHVFECAACSQRLEQVATLAKGIAHVARRRGGLEMVLTESMVESFARSGLKLRSYRATPGDVVLCTVAPDDDLLVTSLVADLRGVERVNVMVSDAQGRTLARIEDAPIEAGSDKVIYTLSGDLARTLPKVTLLIEVLAAEGEKERRLAQYTFEHTPMAAS